MKQLMKIVRWTTLLAVLLFMLAGTTALASDDNSLADLGITTEGVTVSPDFAYDTWTYDVTVPAGTTELALSPVPSSSSATIAEVSGTTLNPDGTGTVYITVQAASGAQFTYTLNVTGGGAAAAAPQPETAAPETQPATEAPVPQTEPPTEVQTEDSRFVKVDKNTIQEAENTITSLKGDIAKYRDTISLYTKIMYGLIAVAVLLLFIVINLILRKRDLKAELNDYRSLSAKKGKGAPGRGGQAPRPAAGSASAQGKGRKAKKGNNAPQAQGGNGAPQPYYQNQSAPVNGPQGQVSGQIRQGQIQYRTPGGTLDVQPQTSTRRKLPEYQKEDMNAAAQNQKAPGAPQNAAPAAAQGSASAAGAQVEKPAAENPSVPQGTQAGQDPAAAGAAQQAPEPRPERQNVEVDMIEL